MLGTTMRRLEGRTARPARVAVATLLAFCVWAAAGAARAEAPDGAEQATGVVVGTILGLVILVALAWLAGHPRVRRLEERLGISQVITAGFPFIALGLIARHPSVGILSDRVLVEITPLLQFGLGWLGFLVGFKFDARFLARMPRGTSLAVSVETVLPFLAIVVAAGFVMHLFGAPWHHAGLLRDAIALGAAGAMTAPAIGVERVLEARRLPRTDLVAQVEQLDELAGILGLLALAAFYRPAAAEFRWVLPGAVWIFVTIGLGVTLGIVISLAATRPATAPEFLAVVLGSVAFAAGLAGYLWLPPIVVCFLAGTVVSNLPWVPKHRLQAVLEDSGTPDLSRVPRGRRRPVGRDGLEGLGAGAGLRRRAAPRPRHRGGRPLALAHRPPRANEAPALRHRAPERAVDRRRRQRADPLRARTGHDLGRHGGHRRRRRERGPRPGLCDAAAATRASAPTGRRRMSRVVIVASLAALLLAARSFVPVETTDTHVATTALAFGFVLLSSFFAGRSVEPLRLPRVTGYLLMGILVGPHVLNLVTAPMVEMLRLIEGVAICLIALTAGGELSLRRIRPLARTVAAMMVWAVLGTAVALGIALVALRPLLPFMAPLSIGQSVAVALVLAVALAAQSPAVVLALVTETESDGPLTRTMLAMVVLSDLVIVVLYAITSSIARVVLGKVTDPGAVVLGIAWEIFGSIGIGVVVGVLLSVYLRKVRAGTPLFVLLTCVVIAEIGRRVHLDPMLVALTAGVFLENVTEVEASKLIKRIEAASLPVYVIFFAVAGAMLDLPALWTVALPAAILAVVRGVAMWGGSVTSGRMTGAPPEVGRHTWTGLLPQAGLAVALAVLLERTFPRLGPPAAVLILGVVALNQIVTPVLTRWALVRSGEAGARREVELGEGGGARERPEPSRR